MTTGADRSLRIGLTGGIASGKSAVADSFAELGVPIVDTDVIAREVVVPGSPALQEIRRAFGRDIITSKGTLDLRALRQLIFEDAGKRRQLEDILHPRIRQEAEHRIAASRAPYLIVVVPLLAESPMKAMMDRILVVDCSERTQIARLRSRDAETEAQARRIMATQASREERLAIADDVIVNEGSFQELRDQVQTLHRSYLEVASNFDS
jgi:dephospho-CoA kinase